MLRLRSRPLRVALVGNPNVGKSVVFGRLTGRYATVQLPGHTVAVTKGRALIGAEVCEVIDTLESTRSRGRSAKTSRSHAAWSPVTPPTSSSRSSTPGTSAGR